MTMVELGHEHGWRREKMRGGEARVKVWVRERKEMNSAFSFLGKP